MVLTPSKIPKDTGSSIAHHRQIATSRVCVCLVELDGREEATSLNLRPLTMIIITTSMPIPANMMMRGIGEVGKGSVDEREDRGE